MDNEQLKKRLDEFFGIMTNLVTAVEDIRVTQKEHSEKFESLEKKTDLLFSASNRNWFESYRN